MFGLLALTQAGKDSMTASKFGLQKKAIDCRAGVMPSGISVLLIFEVEGATTRCKVDRRVSLLQRANKSPVLTTTVPGIGGAGWKRCVRGFWTSNPPTESWKSSVNVP